MNKPKIETKLYYDYSECMSYICNKYTVSEDEFWNWKSDYVEGNGTYINIDTYDLDQFTESSEAHKFIVAMIEEFGTGIDYYVSW